MKKFYSLLILATIFSQASFSQLITSPDALTGGAAAIAGTITSSMTGSALTYYSNGCAAPDGTCSCAKYEHWYVFTTTTAGTQYVITVVGGCSANGCSSSSGMDPVVELRNNTCNGSWIQGSNATGRAATETLTPSVALAANTTYRIRVYAYHCNDAATWNYTIKVAGTTTTPPAYAPQPITPSNPTICLAANGTPNTVQLSSATSGGAWTSGTTSRATVNSSGLVTAASSAGTSLITYTIASTGCTATTTVTVQAPAVPSASTAPATPITCGTAVTLMKATSAGNSIQWYDASTGGTFQGSSSSNVVVSGFVPLVTTHYYAQSLSSGGCISSTRRDVGTVTVNPIAAPTLSVTQPTCASANGTVAVTSTTSGFTFSSNGTLYTSYPAGGYTVAAGAAYSITQKNAAGCVSSAAAGTMGSQPVNSVTPTVNSPLCAGTTSVSGTSAEANGSTVTVYKGGVAQGTTTTITAGAWTVSGISALASGDVITAKVQAVGECLSAASSPVVVSFTPVLSNTSGSSSICAGRTVFYIHTNPVLNNPVWNITPSSAGTLTYSSGGDYEYATNYNTSGASVTFQVTSQASDGSCTSNSLPLTIWASPAAVTVNPSSGSYCGNVLLTATGGSPGTIYWENTFANNTNTTTPTTTQTVSSGGTYYFRARESTHNCWGPDGSATVTITPVASTSVTLADNSANGNGAAMCDAANITYTATPTNGGSNPVYDFKVNNVSVQTGASNQYITSAINNGDAIKCIMTSNAACASPVSPVSNTITATITACGYTWTGAGANHLWTNAANWSPGVPPNTCGSNVTIQNVANYPILTGNVTLGSVTVQDNATMDLATNNLSACGDWNGGPSFAGAVTGTGMVILSGSSPQNITGRTNFPTLRLNNASGAIMGASSFANIFARLDLQTGNLNTSNGALTLKSTATSQGILNNFSSGYTGTLTGNITVERYIANNAQGYRDISSPVASTVADWAADFSVVGQNGVNCWYSYSPYPSLQYYNESDNSVTHNYYGGWISYTNGSSPLQPMKGYAARIYTAPLTITTTGAPNNGPQSIQLTKTTSTITSADGWNLIGNPYPSAISWNAVKALNPSITTASNYKFNSTGEYAGNWAAFNGTTGTNGATDEIGVSQGLFVSALGTNSLNMDNSVRIASTSTGFFKTRSQTNEIRLQLSNTTQTDEIVAYTDGGATSGFDADYDATKMPAGSTVYLSFDMPDKEYAINVLDAITEQTELPLTLWVTDTGSYTFSATELNLSGLTAYLKDAAANTLYNLASTSPSLVLNGGQTYSSRYSIVFKAEVVSAIEEQAATGVKIYSSGDRVYVERTSALPAQVTISNILGQQVATSTLHSEKAQIQLPGSEQWYAFVKVTEGKKVTMAKVLISNK